MRLIILQRVAVIGKKPVPVAQYDCDVLPTMGMTIRFLDMNGFQRMGKVTDMEMYLDDDGQSVKVILDGEGVID